MQKKLLFMAALLTVVSVVFLAGCGSTQDSTSNGVGNQSQAAQVSGSKGTTSDAAQNTANPAEQYVRTDNGEGGVQVEAVRITPEYLKAVGKEDLNSKYDYKRNIVIEISMTTHMGDLSQYPILNNAELTVNGDMIKPAKWDVSSGNSHHPRGFLVFPVKDSTNIDGSRLELNLRQLNGVPERKFAW